MNRRPPKSTLFPYPPLSRSARGGAGPIESVGNDRHRRVEADAVVGLREIVVDRLGNADHADALLVEPLGHPKCVVAADRDERVDSPAANTVEHRPARGLILARVRARGSEDGPALAEDAVRVSHTKRTWL